MCGKRGHFFRGDCSHNKCIHIRRCRGTEKHNPQRARRVAAPVTLPDALANVLRQYHSIWTATLRVGCLLPENNRPPSKQQRRGIPALANPDALDIPRCGLHAFRHSVASFIVDAGYSPESRKTTASVIPTPAQHSTTFICEAESQNGRWRMFQIP